MYRSADVTSMQIYVLITCMYRSPEASMQIYVLITSMYRSPEVTSMQIYVLITCMYRSPGVTLTFTFAVDVRSAYMKVKQSHHRSHLSRMCKKFNVNPSNYLDRVLDTWQTQPFSSFLAANDTNRFMYCTMPLVASGVWLKIASTLAGSSIFDLHTSYKDKLTEAGFIPVRDFGYYSDSDNAYQRLLHYYKALAVRHPQDRLLALYRNKLEYSQDLKYVKSINKMNEDIFGRSFQVSGTTGYNITFKDFVHLVIVLYNKGMADESWAPYWYLCQPCLIGYDFVVHFDTYMEDMEYLLEQVTGHSITKEIKRFMNIHSKSNEMINEKYYKQVNRQDMLLLRMMYQTDLTLFKYKFKYYKNVDYLDSKFKDKAIPINVNANFTILRMQSTAKSTKKL